MRNLTCLSLILLSSLFVTSCGDDDDDALDVAGAYSIAVTNGPNDCELDNWNQGDQSTAIPFTITQVEDSVTGVIGGLAGTYVSAVLGSDTFTGNVDGAEITMTLFGTTSGTVGNCTFTVNAEVAAHFDEAAGSISGTISYVPHTNDSPDCGAKNDCANVQNFSGVRPPPAQ